MTDFYAQPYSPEYVGFYFSTLEEYEVNMKRLNDVGCEEVEIELIKVDFSLYIALFYEINPTQSTISLWFDKIEDIDYVDGMCLLFLLQLQIPIIEALKRIQEVVYFDGTAADYAQELTEESIQIPESLINYIDYEAMAQDMELNGDIVYLKGNFLIVNVNDF
jgi:hypothetical protein